MRKDKKSKKRGIIILIIIMASIFTIISCKPWPEIIKGVGIWGKSRYGKAVFGEEKRGILGENLGEGLGTRD